MSSQSLGTCKIVKSYIGLPHCLLCLCLATASWQAWALDLMQAYRAALPNDPTLAAARATYRAAVEVVPQARAALGPKVQASVSANAAVTKQSQSERVRGSATEGALSLTQPLLDVGASRSLEQAKAQLPGFEAQLKLAEQDVMLRVTRSYIDVLLAQDTLDQLQKQKEAVEAQLQRAKRTYEIGTGTVIDREDAKARFDLISATELQGRGNLAVAMRRLEGLMGQPIEGPFTTVNPAMLPIDDMLKAGIQHWDARAESESLQVLQAQALSNAQRMTIDVVQAERLPTLGLVAALTQRNLSQSGLSLNNDGDGRSAQVGVALSMPLWNSGSTSSRIRQSIALADQATENLAQAKRNARLDARQSYIGLTTSLAQIEAYEQAVESTQVSLSASLRGSEVGARTMLDVLNARQQLFQARTDLARARYGLVLSALSLKATVGELNEADLQRLSQGRVQAVPALTLLPEAGSVRSSETMALHFDLNLSQQQPKR